MLTANSILIGVLGINLVRASQAFAKVGFVLPIAGLILCVIWLLLNKHGLKWQNYFIREAARLETEHFLNSFNIFRAIDSEEIKRHSVMKYIHLSRVVIIVFFCVYGYMLYENCSSYICLPSG